jgi:uncharacterized protein (UPF0332 family)
MRFFIFMPEMFDIYKNAFSLRQESDYDAMYVPDLETTAKLFTQADKFVKQICEII